ncbi:hypothetical protein LTR84_006952 [Exophiala bonariae]|uniref:N,N-dimethylformamidase beta subunit-like C-terminal domain-containing protein n=1 Tax=Exophiala bonariae TaxID=1690606 RepID=A0AAV9N2E6_9EURO|nr:hypothetical protein LTR84_006952 [Exophiala bonariae]
MSTIEKIPVDYRLEITCYADPWIFSPGEEVEIKVSCTETEYSYRTVRVIQGVDQPHSPKQKLEEVVGIPSGTCKGRFQVGRCGPYAIVRDWVRSHITDGLEVSLYFQPHVVGPGNKWTQCIISNLDVSTKTGFAVLINSEGLVELWIGNAQSSVFIVLDPIPHVVEKIPPTLRLEFALSNPFVLNPSPHSSLILAGSYAKSPFIESIRVTNFFNGRIHSPMIKSLATGILVQYDFGRYIPEDTIIDISGAGHHGILVNAPTRGICGYNWDGTEVAWTKAKYGYGAILSTKKIWMMRRVYAVEVIANQAAGRQLISDMINFIVRTTDQNATATNPKIALVLPTFTYLAYANDKLGLSTYDVHSDGSGNAYSTSRRPIMNFKPGFLSYGLGRPRHLSAGSMMIGFLEYHNLPYDILTDHGLHLHGVSCLLPYATVITGGHPEYPTSEVYNSYDNYAKRGGNLMYLDGNGFYWVTASDAARSWRIEVRRGELGGLWRSQGGSSHALFGVAFCSQGRPPGVPYKRTEAGDKPEFDWLFKDIPKGELIGEYGLGGGASGDELDSFDIEQGSPVHGVIVATTTGHPDGFGIASECAKYPILATRGSETRDIRSDMVYYETKGGAVFSVGSINWYPSLAWDGYKNNVAQLTLNVIAEFLSRSKRGGQM